MIITVIGLGLIGGSLCKTIKKYTEHTCYGYDIDGVTIGQALACKAIDKAITLDELRLADLTILCLHPQRTIDFLTAHADSFRKGSLVIDTCGVKQQVISQAEPILNNNDVGFVGCHPMAGREFSGFSYAVDSLFDKASFIITPTGNTPPAQITFVREFINSLHFKKIVVSTPAEHDRVIAFTSQLAHIVSNAYVKSPSLLQESGFSAGSFMDLTRVAKLNEDMWTELFLMNREPLLEELDTIIAHLQEYREALASKEQETMRGLLRDGRIRKEESLLRHPKEI